LFFLPSGRGAAARPDGRKNETDYFAFTQGGSFLATLGWMTEPLRGSRTATIRLSDTARGCHKGHGAKPAEPSARDIGTPLRWRIRAARTGNAANIDAGPILRAIRTVSGNPNGMKASSPPLTLQRLRWATGQTRQATLKGQRHWKEKIIGGVTDHVGAFTLF
jgi:hypothetical protein